MTIKTPAAAAVLLAQLALAVSSLTLLVSPPTHADTTGARAEVGVVDRAKAPATAIFAADKRALDDTAPVYYLDLLRTGAGARLRVELADASKISMGENTELRIDEFVYTPETRTEATLNLVKGALLFIGDKLRGDEQRAVRVRTPVAILGARGTHFWVGPIDGATGVLVVDGEVLVGTAAGRIRLGPGEGTMIQSDGALTHAKVWGEAKVRRALEMVAFD